LQGSSIRCYKKESLVFKPLETQTRDVVLDEKNIIDKPQKIKKQEIKNMVINSHNYSKGKEEVEAYNWYISTTENVRITFAEPLHSVKAYEVTGVDEYGQDTVSENPSSNVIFIETGANYVLISNKSSNKIVIRGLKYTDSVVKLKRTNSIVAVNESYEDKEIDLTISDNPWAVCELLYALHSRKNSIIFNTIQDVEAGGFYSILGERLHIKKKRQTLNGVYEVEAV
jgi:hypothetical protein